VEDALELHRGAAVDRFLDVEPRQLVVALEHVEVECDRVHVEHRDPVLVEVGRETRSLEQHRPAV
jgi:hypothetical protein